MVRGRSCEAFYTRKFITRKFVSAKISRSTVCKVASYSDAKFNIPVCMIVIVVSYIPNRCEGRNPVEYVGIETYLNPEPSTEEQKDTLLLSTLQGFIE